MPESGLEGSPIISCVKIAYITLDQAHKQICRTKSEFAESIAAFSQSPLGMFSQRLLPDGISMQELDQRLEKWVKFHHQTLMAACLHALRLPDDESRARTHVMHLILLPRQDHGGHPGKWFKVVDAKALEWSEAEKKRTPWPESLAQVRDMQDDAQSKGQGRIAAAMLDCPPLSVQTVPFGSINNQMKQVKVLPIWREVLIKVILTRSTSTGD